MPEKMKLTKSAVDDLLKRHQQSLIDTPDGASQKDVLDTVLNGFLVRLGKTKAVYGVLVRRNGKLIRSTIGEHGVYFPDHSDPKLNARKQARSLIAEMDKGENPNIAKKERRERGITLAEAYRAYLEENPRLRPRTIKEYSGLLRLHAGDWLDTPLKDLTGTAVQKRHREVTAKSGDAQANKLVRTLRAICNQNADVLPDNPARMPRKKWNPSVRRDRLVQAHQLSDWFIGLSEYRNQDITDYVMLLLLTGMRRSEGFSLLWEDVDLTAKTLIARDTKNGKDHTMPLSDFLCEILARREPDKVNRYVFPSLTSASGHLEEPKKVLAAVAKKTGIAFSFHDLRRTFMSAAASLGISETLIKRLVNHSINDVTGGYIFSIESSGPHQRMQEITDLTLGYITRPAAVLLAINLLLDQEAKRAAKVISLDDRRRSHG